jgi:hypothetical protein
MGSCVTLGCRRVATGTISIRQGSLRSDASAIDPLETLIEVSIAQPESSFFLIVISPVGLASTAATGLGLSQFLCKPVGNAGKFEHRSCAATTTFSAKKFHRFVRSTTNNKGMRLRTRL